MFSRLLRRAEAPAPSVPAPSTPGRRPDFLGIGAQKAGTTWLHAQMRRHPGLYLPDQKEIHFWNSQRDRGLDWYYGLFTAAAAEAKAGEITPAYGFLPDPAVAEIRAEMPDLRLVYSLRNPVERAWSSALMALGRAEMTLGEASDQWFVDHFLSSGSRRRGDYLACLQTWWRHFGTEAVCVVWFDDIVTQPRGVLRRLAAHLGISAAPFDALPDEALSAAVNAGPGTPLPAHLAAFLCELYRPRIEALEVALGRDLSHWKEPPADG